jgi:hypothetical protein
MSAFVFRAGPHVQSHQCLTEHAVVEAEVRSGYSVQSFAIPLMK